MDHFISLVPAQVKHYEQALCLSVGITRLAAQAMLTAEWQQECRPQHGTAASRVLLSEELGMLSYDRLCNEALDSASKRGNDKVPKVLLCLLCVDDTCIRDIASGAQLQHWEQAAV